MSIDTPAQPTTKVALDVIVSRDDLANALAFTSVAVSTRPPVPILTGVKIRAYNHEVTLSTTDYGTWTWENIPAPGASGEAVLPHAALLKIVKSLPKGSLTVTIKVSGNRAVISDGETIFKVPTLDVDAFPERPHRAEHRIFEMPGADFNAVVTKVTSAASRDDTLPILMQVCFRVGMDGTTLYATDRYRLTSYEINQIPETTRSPLVGAKVLADVAGHFKTSALVRVRSDEVRRAGGFYTSIDDGRRGVTLYEQEGDYPSVGRLFPAETYTTVDLDTVDLLRAIKQVDVARFRNTPVRFDMTGDPIILSAGDGDDMQAERPLTVKAEHQVPDQAVESVALNPQFLIDAVKSCGGKKARMMLAFHNKPVLFVDNDDPAFRHLVVPVRFAQ